MSSPQSQSSSASSSQPDVQENGVETPQLSTVTAESIENISLQDFLQLDEESPALRSLLRLPVERRRALADEIDVVVSHLRDLFDVVERFCDPKDPQMDKILEGLNASTLFRDDSAVLSEQSQPEPDPDKKGDGVEPQPSSGDDVQSESNGTSSD